MCYRLDARVESLLFKAIDATEFGLKGVSLCVKTTDDDGDNGTDVAFIAQDIFVKDIRPCAIESSKFTRILFLEDAGHGVTEDNTRLSLNVKHYVKKSGVSCVVCNFSLMSPTFYFIPEAINGITSFFDSTETVGPAKVEDNNENNSNSNDSSAQKELKKSAHESDKTSSSSNKPQYSIRVNLKFEGSVVIPENVADSNAQLMVLDVDFDSEALYCTDVHVQGFLNVNDLSVYTCLAEHRTSTKTVIVRSCPLTLSVTRSYTEDILVCAANFPTPVTMVLTYNNVKLVALTFMRLFMKEEASTASGNTGNSKPVLKEASSNNTKAVQSNNNNNNNASTYGISLSTMITRFETILINDISGENLPVLSSSFGLSFCWGVPSATKAAHEEATHELGSVNVSAKVYDWALSEWVPFVENWDLDAAYTMAQRDLKGVTIRARRPLVLTVAASTVKVLKSLVDTVNSEYEAYLRNPDGTITRKRFVPYAFMNKAGMPIGIRLSGVDLSVGPGEEMLISDDVIKEVLGLKEGADIPRECEIFWGPNTMAIPINKEGVFSLGSLVVSVSVEENGRKKVLLRSKMIVRNCSQNVVSLGAHMGSEIEEIEEMQPGGECSVPLRFFDGNNEKPLFKALVLREGQEPAAAVAKKKKKWSEPFYIYNRDIDTYSINNDMPIAVYNSSEPEGAGPRTYCVNTEVMKVVKYGYENTLAASGGSSSSGSFSARHRWEEKYRVKVLTFLVGPPLVLANDLPVVLHYKTPNAHGCESSLEPGESVHFYDPGDVESGKMMVALRLDEAYKTRWADNVLSHETVHFKSVCTGKTIATVKMHVEKDTRKGVKSVACVSATYWVKNETEDVMLLSTDMVQEIPLFPDSTFPVCADVVFLRFYNVLEPSGVSLKDFVDKKTVDFIFLKGRDRGFPDYDLVLKPRYYHNNNNNSSSSSSSGDGLCGPLSKQVIVIKPRFVLDNRTDEHIFYRFPLAKGSNEVEHVVEPHSRRPIQRQNKLEDPLKLWLRIGKSGLPTRVSLASVDSFPFRARTSVHGHKFFDVDVDIQGEATVLRIRPTSISAPQMVLENTLPYSVSIFQECNSKNSNGDYCNDGSDSFSAFVVDPMTSVPFGWDQPDEPRRISFMKISSFEVCRLGVVSSYPLDSGACIIVNVRLQHKAAGGRATRVIQIKIIDSALSAKKNTGTMTYVEDEEEENDDNEETCKGKITTTTTIAATGSGGKHVVYRFYLNEFDISVINNVPEEILYVSVGGIEAEYSQHGRFTKANLKVKHFQVDNQLEGEERMYPAIIHKLRPVRPEEARPLFFQLALELRSAGENYVKSLLMDLAPFAVNAEERFLSYFEKTFLSAFSGSTTGTAASATTSLAQVASPNTTNLDPDNTDDGSSSSNRGNNNKVQMMYIESLILGDVRFSLTFMPASASSEKLMSTWWYRAFGGAARLENCMLTFDPLCISDLYASPGVIAKRICRFYKGELKKKIVSVIFSISLIGNPVGFFREVRTGVDCLKDSRGVRGFFAHTTVGAANSLSSMTSTVSSGLRKLSGSSGRSTVPAPVGMTDGLLRGIKSIGDGIGNGVTGLVKAPASGCKTGGVSGFFKGLGHGIAGVVAQPVAGALDAMSNVNKGISATLSECSVKSRHPQRLIVDKVISPYDFDKYYYYGALQNRVASYEVLRRGDAQMPSLAVVEDEKGNLACVSHNPDYRRLKILWHYKRDTLRMMRSPVDEVLGKVKSLGVTSPEALHRAASIVASATAQNRKLKQVSTY